MVCLWFLFSSVYLKAICSFFLFFGHVFFVYFGGDCMQVRCAVKLEILRQGVKKEGDWRLDILMVRVAWRRRLSGSQASIYLVCHRGRRILNTRIHIGVGKAGVTDAVLGIRFVKKKILSIWTKKWCEKN